MQLRLNGQKHIFSLSYVEVFQKKKTFINHDIMAATVALGPIKPLTHKPVFQIPPQPLAAPSIYFKSPFDPEKHLIYNGVLPKRHTMEELSFPADQGISPIAVSEPFELFSKEAVKHMRNEVLSDEVWDNCRFSSSIAACQLRGMSPKYVFP